MITKLNSRQLLLLICFKFQFEKKAIIRTLYFYLLTQPLFRKKSFVLNFLTQRNASKFAMFMKKENPHSFFILSNWSMSTQTRAFIKGKVQWLKMKNEKNFEVFGWTFSLSANFLILKSDCDLITYHKNCDCTIL